MPRRYTVFEIGHFYHIYNREKEKKPMFVDSTDYLHFLKLWQKYIPKYNLTLIAYCLMPTHFHLLIRIDGQTDVSGFLCNVFNAYAKGFNKKYHRKGSLFADRFQTVHVDDHNYLLHLCRYIHLNSLKAGIVKNLYEWPFSNYLEFCDKRDGKIFDQEFRDELFGTALEYEEFVNDLAIEEPDGFEKVLLENNPGVARFVTPG